VSAGTTTGAGLTSRAGMTTGAGTTTGAGLTPLDLERQAELRRLAEQAGRDLEGAPALEVARWAAERFGSRLAVAGSMQDAVLVDLFARVAPGVDVLFLETGYHFPQTLATRDAVAAALPVRVRDLLPVQSVAEQDAEYGERLHERDPDLCCALRKVEPLDRALAGYDAWATGVRRDEAPTRATTPVVGWDARHAAVKIAPLVRWSAADVEAYANERNLPRNPLVDDGYPSIGCAPCTRRVAPGEDPRSGRWGGSTKTECGIHR
jgi:phosphoadenosine phosphosulfate reductase